MKFVDLINEEFIPDSEQLKELNRAKAVYTAYKKGALIFMHYSNRNKDEKDNIVKYKLGEPEYNWYPRNGNKNDMYLTVQVKNLTVYIKDPVLYDALVNPKRINDYYMPLIYNFINPKAIRKFEKRGVKLHIGEPKVNFVLLEPEETKEPEQINEGELSDKDNKTVKAVYQVLKKGMVKRIEEHGEALFSYKLSDEFKAHIEDGALHVTPDGMKIKEMNKAASNSNFASVYTTLKKRFKNYKINFNVPPMKWSDLIDYVPEDALSKEPINEELSDKDIKKCKVLWSQFKKGAVIINDKKYRYELRDEYKIISVPSNPHPIIEIQGTFENSLRLYDVQENGHNILLDYGLENRLYSEAKSKVRNKFNNYRVHLSL